MDGFIQTSKIKNSELTEDEFSEQVEVCERFIGNYFERSYRYKLDKKLSIFDISLIIKNYCKACKVVGVNTAFAEIQNIDINALRTAFENLDFT
ncbi:MAG: hypothetical protein LLG05_14625, partial [Porphyromonadaceae bacterium]|nr:hypothetical protein [Porphyromonadaceae bacterium]